MRVTIGALLALVLGSKFRGHWKRSSNCQLASCFPDTASARQFVTDPAVETAVPSVSSRKSILSSQCSAKVCCTSMLARCISYQFRHRSAGVPQPATSRQLTTGEPCLHVQAGGSTTIGRPIRQHAATRRCRRLSAAERWAIWRAMSMRSCRDATHRAAPCPTITGCDHRIQAASAASSVQEPDMPCASCLGRSC